MKRTRSTAILASALAVLPLAAVGCGTATTSSSGDGPGGSGSSAPPSSSPPTSSPESARAFATALLARVQMPPEATATTRAPSKVLESLPEMPGLVKPPVVVDRFWSVDSSARDLLDWLQGHLPAGLDANGSGRSGSGASVHFIAYRSSSLPRTIAVGDVYLSVVATGPSTSAVAAHALALAQPHRPAAERVPAADVSSAMIGWSLAANGTPVRKVLTGAAASALARDFNALRVSPSPAAPCPLIPTVGGDIVVRFTAEGHTWVVGVPACPAISVARDGAKLPSLEIGKVFLDELKKYVGHLPQSGPPRAGEVIPLGQMPTGH